jgi:hypothetical protein
MMNFHQSSEAQYSENKAGGFPSGINTSNETLSPYDRAQLLVSQSASKIICGDCGRSNLSVP